MLLVAEARRVRELLLRRGDLRGQLVNGARQSHLRENFTPGSSSSFLSLVWWNPLRERPALRHEICLSEISESYEFSRRGKALKKTRKRILENI